MITSEDMKILRYIEEVGMCTSSQIAKIFYPSQSQSNAIARRRLNEMIKEGYLTAVTFNLMSRRKIYIYKNKKYQNLKPSLHRLLLLDYHAELIYLGVDIKYFKIEQPWLNGSIRSDAFCIYTINDKVFYDCIEVCTSNNFRNIKKYNDLYESDEVYQFTNREFPRIVVIDNIKMDCKNINKNIKVIQLDYNLNPIATLFV